VRLVSLRPLTPRFYARDTSRVARALLGCVLESRVDDRHTAGRIVEVEAYLGAHDPADHGFGYRRTVANARLFGPPGTAYVYRSHGIHWCVNAVTERRGEPSAVLLRALEPLVGLRWMRARRGTTDSRRLCAGPGCLCAALGITGKQDGIPLHLRRLRILRVPGRSRLRIGESPRIGVSAAREWPLRFFIQGSAWLSRPPRRAVSISHS
jgi:DNA-3-methyladenine glycosylase